MTETPPTLTALTAYLLSRTGKAARERVTARLASEGMRMWHMAVLAALADFGPHSQRELSARLNIDPSDVTKVLDELAALGRIDRAPDPGDRRRRVVTLNDEGAAALRRLDAQARAVQNDLLAPLDAAERRQLHDMLARLFVHLHGGGERENRG
jgi:DNA-binding MarR family transcriptional regulator